MGFLEWLGMSPLGLWVSENGFVYYSLLAGHAIGMGVVVGTSYMMAARTLGLWKSLPFGIFNELFSIVWIGFGLNALTGLLLFSANGKNLVQNAPFLTKLTFIGLGGLAIWGLQKLMEAESSQVSETQATSWRVKATAVLVIAFWTGAILAGRLIAYTVDYF